MTIDDLPIQNGEFPWQYSFAGGYDSAGSGSVVPCGTKDCGQSEVEDQPGSGASMWFTAWHIPRQQISHLINIIDSIPVD